MRDEFRSVLAQAFPGARFFVRMAPAGSAFLWASDILRKDIDKGSLEEAQRVLPVCWCERDNLLWGDFTEAYYRTFFESMSACSLPACAWKIGMEELQATALLLLHDAVPPRPVDWPMYQQNLREAWRVFAVGGKPYIHQWAAETRREVAVAKREGKDYGAKVSGLLLHSYIAQMAKEDIR